MKKYIDRKEHKILMEKFGNLEIRFAGFFERDQRKGEMIRWLNEYRELRDSLIQTMDKEIDDIQHEKDEEISDLKSEMEILEIRIENLEEKQKSLRIQSLEDEMKLELLQAAIKKYTLSQLEEKIGNRFQLM